MGFHTGELVKVETDRSFNGQVVTVVGFDHPASHKASVEPRPRGQSFCFICWTTTDNVVVVSAKGRKVVLAAFEVRPLTEAEYEAEVDKRARGNLIADFYGVNR